MGWKLGERAERCVFPLSPGNEQERGRVKQRFRPFVVALSAERLHIINISPVDSSFNETPLEKQKFHSERRANG